MRRLPRRLALLVLGAPWAAACGGAPVPGGPKPGGRLAAEPVLRVGVVVGADTVRLSSEGWLRIADGDAGSLIAVSDSVEIWRVVRDRAGRLRVLRPDGWVSQPHRRLLAEPFTRAVRVNGVSYRGSVVVIPGRRSGVTAINTVGLEDYLLGVVPAEIGDRPPSDLEAVEAQAVAARTYTIAYLGARDSLGFDVFGDVGDQVYAGLASERALTTRAVQETRGVVATHGGRPIDAYYHSTCGGATSAIQDVWPRPGRPYLVSVSDAIPGAEGRFYCDISPHFRWEERWRIAQLREVLARTLPLRTGIAPARLGPIVDVRVTERSKSGRARRLEIETVRASHTVRGDDIRWVLEPQPGRPLRSTLFVATWANRGTGEDELRVQGGGWGHGVGMCQWGAIGRARAGKSYEEILKAYYPGIELERWY